MTEAHRRRLREVWRSAGWPYLDGVEAELVAAGLLERRIDAAGRETVRVSDAGVAQIAQTLQRNRARRDAHEALVERIALEMQRAGRIVWRGLSLRAPLAGDDGRTNWVTAMPDVFSIRHTTVEDYVEPIVHEVKVRRADLLAELRRPDKARAYAALAAQVWFVLGEGVGSADEIPAEYGVVIRSDDELTVARAPTSRRQRVPFAVWMALARTVPVGLDEGGQPGLAPVPPGSMPGAGVTPG